jgi:hypothetical protein
MLGQADIKKDFDGVPIQLMLRHGASRRPAPSHSTLPAIKQATVSRCRRANSCLGSPLRSHWRTDAVIRRRVRPVALRHLRPAVWTPTDFTSRRDSSNAYAYIDPSISAQVGALTTEALTEIVDVVVLLLRSGTASAAL